MSVQGFRARVDWSASMPADVRFKRAGGRRHYNARRQSLALFRLTQLASLLMRYGWPAHGSQALVARALGVSEATISRDMKAVRTMVGHCPECGGPRVRPRLEQLEMMRDRLLERAEYTEVSR
jgi:hypothetical protein